eukprot:3414804-Prymnesium_polylepis.1
MSVRSPEASWLSGLPPSCLCCGGITRLVVDPYHLRTDAPNPTHQHQRTDKPITAGSLPKDAGASREKGAERGVQRGAERG